MTPPKKQLVTAVPTPVLGAATDYAALLGDIKQRIGAARIRATLAANFELVLLYWDVGHLILQRQSREG